VRGSPSEHSSEVHTRADSYTALVPAVPRQFGRSRRTRAAEPDV